MPDLSETKLTPELRFKMTIALLGTIFIVSWIAIAAIANLAAVLPCHFSPNACSEGRQNANAILLAPLVIGSAFVAFGYASIPRINLILKILIGATLWGMLSYITWYALIIAHVMVHGL